MCDLICSYRQVHDFWHVLFDCPTNVTGEVAVKIIEGIQVSHFILDLVLNMCAAWIA